MFVVVVVTMVLLLAVMKVGCGCGIDGTVLPLLSSLFVYCNIAFHHLL